MPYRKSLDHLRVLIQDLGVKLVIRNNAVGPQGCYYDPDRKLIHLSRHDVSRKMLVELLLHEYCHRWQDAQGYFDDNVELQKGERLLARIIHDEKQYVPGKHKKYRDRLLRMQYDADRKAVEAMSKMHDLRDYIGLHRYIKEANFYAAYIKYQFRTGKTKTGGYAESDARKAHFVGDELMGDDELTSELTEQGLSYFERMRR